MPLALLAGCTARHQPPSIVVAPFQEMARGVPCTDIRNRLFLVDGEKVLWDRRGSCPDNGYAQTLFGRTPSEVLCRAHDSIAGPQTTCDAANAESFDVMLENLDAPDLGLGSRHNVQAIPLQ